MIILRKNSDEDLAFPLSIFKHARLFDPSKVVDLHPTTSDVNGLRIFPFLDSDHVIHELKTELPQSVYSSS